MEKDKYGLMGCSRPLSNVGDFVQSIAARQFLPQVDVYCDREELNTYDGDDVKMIMNGWYMHEPANWPPSDKIDPLYVAMHINPTAIEGMTNEASLAHYKKHEPIGCRDMATYELLKSKGIDAYFSACLTLTLGKTYKRDSITDDIYIIDPLFHYLTLAETIAAPKKLANRLLSGRFFKELSLKNNVLKSVFTSELLQKAKYVTQMVPIVNTEQSFKTADEYLKMLANAKFVVTSRIHCALPCLAMGTPVVFLNGGFGGKGGRFDSRFGGLIDLFNRVDIDKNGKMTYNFEHDGKIGVNTPLVNKTLHIPYVQAISKRVEEFIKG
nr:polysaccharide pyruvyl transferase family protein [uncultured Mucilaginibacter sp.]